MTAISVTKARENIYQILSDVLYLDSISGMAESIIGAGREPLEKCSVYDPNEEW